MTDLVKKKMLRFTFGILIIFCIVIAGYYFFGKEVTLTSSTEIEAKGKWIQDIGLDKSMYAPSSKVEIHSTLTNEENDEFKGRIIIKIQHLSDVVDQIEKEIVLDPGENKKLSVSWTTPKQDYKGYLVEAWLVKGGEVLDKRNTAVDVSSDWAKFPRYGYLVDFGKANRKALTDRIETLANYHINGLQFYDWQDKHHQPLSVAAGDTEENWQDIANRPVNADTVKEYIDAIHENNMMAMNYNLMFGAYTTSEDDGVKPEWGLYKDARHEIQDSHPLPSVWETSRLLLENPANEGWQDYILKEEQKVFDTFDFDGWHVDQLGDRGRQYDYDGNIIDLKATYKPFLEETKQQLDTKLVMNAVNQYGQLEIAQSPVDFLYTEVWPPAISSYGQLKRVIDAGNTMSKGTKNMVLAAYMNYAMADRTGEFNTPGVLMTDSVIFASGGSHIELGDTGMLGKEYFPNHNLKMTPELKLKLRNYYNFLVAYENLLRDDVKNTERIVDSPDVSLENYPVKEKVWYFTKEKNGYEILHLINFSNYKSLLWRDDTGTQPEPGNLKDFTINYHTDAPIDKVYAASPNIDGGSPIELEFEKGEDEDGSFVTITIPSLEYWDMIYFKTVPK